MSDPIFPADKADRSYRRFRGIIDRFKRRGMILTRDELATLLETTAAATLEFADAHDPIRAESYAPHLHAALDRIMAEEFPADPRVHR